MKRVQLFLFYLFISVTLEANYCVQVLTTNKNESQSVIRQASSRDYNQFDNVRVETRGHYLVFRIGDYRRYKDASSDIKRIREISSDAYVRKCDFIREKAIYINNDSEQSDNPYDNVGEKQQQRVQRYTPPVSKSVRKKSVVQKAVQKEYKKKEELRYTNSNEANSLWGECKKCFIPVYEEEEVEHTVQVQNAEARKVKPQTVEPRKESFWAEDIPQVEESSPTIQKRHKARNKFNIDEQFLP